MFDSLAKDVSGTLTGMFGALAYIEREGYFRHDDIDVVFRKDVEMLDEQEQVVSRVNTIRIAHKGLPVVPERGDRVVIDCDTYILGKRIFDDGNHYLFEATS